MFIPSFISSIILGGIEELGWRGVLLPELIKKYNHIVSTLIVGIVWGLWHMPLFYVVGTGHFGGAFMLFVLSCIGMSAILTWLYVKTNNILLCVVFHASLNATGRIGLSLPWHEIGAYMTHTFVTIIIGLILVLSLTKKTLSKA